MSINKATHSLITTLKRYFEQIVYVGDKKSTLDLIMTLWIIDEVYDWADWYELSLKQKSYLQELRINFIRENPELSLLSYVSNDDYKNVNMPQTIYTWQRVYDYIEPQIAD